jgi:drug/metabolite transporter (DMT)-like permease
LFLIFGVNDSALKFRVEFFPESSDGVFFSILFGSALLVTVILTLLRRERYETATLLIGVPLGAVNFGTALFLSKALELLPGYVVYTLNSVGVIVLASVAGRVIWKEKLLPRNYIFLAGSIVAIVLLSGVATRH